MGIFDILKNKKEDNSKAKEDFEKALNIFEEGSYQDALRMLSWGFQKDVNYKPLYELSVKCLQKLGATDETQLFNEALNNFNNFESFNALGLHFYNDGHYDLALPFLEKAVLLDSSKSDTIHDLAIVYARRFQIEKAVNLLERNNPQNDFWNYWFWCKLRILAGKTDGIMDGLNDLIDVLDQEENQDDVYIPRQKVEELQEMLLRYELIENPRNHIQDWHFIQYGDVILDYFEDSEEFVAGGRYVATWGSNESIKEINCLLKYYLNALNLDFEKVKYLNDRNSEIIGRAIGQELNLVTEVYVSNEISENCLIIGANSFDFDDYSELSTVRNGQLLFSLNQSWLGSASISPDIIGLMSQTYYFPWDGGSIKIIDVEKGITEKTEMDTRSATKIAEDIFNEKSELIIDEEKLNYYLKNKEYLKAIGSKINKHRFNFMIESPVPGSYFG